MDDAHGAMTTTVANTHDINLRNIVQEKILYKMLKHTTQLTHGWVVFVVDDITTRVLSYAVRMSDITDCGVSIIERLELNRQPFPEMNVVYFIAPTVEAVRKVARDFPSDETKAKYNDVYLFFLHHVGDDVLEELKQSPVLLQRLKGLQEVNIDFLALEKCAFSLDMHHAFHQLYSPTTKKGDVSLLHKISDKLVSVCATLEEYPYVRYKADQPRMEQLAQIFQAKMNDFVAKNNSFTYSPNRGTLLFIDRGQDTVSPFMHESTFQAMVYDLLDVEEEQITYPAETNAGIVTKTAFLNENDKLWIEFRHTHIAQVSKEIGKRMSSLAASNAGASLGKGKSTDLSSMAAALRELPEYREMLGKLSQHLYLAGKAMDIFTSTSLLQTSNLEQTMATGVDESGKKLKLATITKQLEDLFKDPKLTESDRARLVAVFLLTQDGLKDVEKKKIQQSASLSAKYEMALSNLLYLAGHLLYKQNGIGLLSAEELKDATKKAGSTEYSNARYDPKIKSTIEKALKNTLEQSEYPYIIAPPLKSSSASGSDDAKKKNAPMSLRKKNQNGKKDGDKDNSFSGEKLIVFMSGGATYSELRSIYEVRTTEKRDVILGTTAFLKPKTYLESLATLQEDNPKPMASSTARGAEIKPLTSGEIHLQVEQQTQLTQPPTLTN